MNLRQMVPFGLLEKEKPRHFREMVKVAWDNRKSLPYAWRILRHGVCDGCSLGPYGLRDNVMDGVHLCLTRLKLLKFNTQPAFHPENLPDLDALRKMSNRELHGLGRLAYPLLREDGDRKFRRISWDEAYSRVSARVARYVDAGVAERIAFYVTSRGVTNETYYVVRKLAALLGTNNIDLCARLCHAASVVGLKETLGEGAPTGSLRDLIETDLVCIFGSNLANNQPVTTKYLHYAKKRGAKILTVNPFREPGLDRYWIPSIPSSALFGTKLTDQFFRVSIGGDVAFIYGVLKALKGLHALDRDFIAKSTNGFENLESIIDELEWHELEAASGLRWVDMERFAKIYAKAKSAVFVYSMGLTQHRFGVDNVRSIVNLALARGMIGRKNCGILPIRGHSGVQGGGEVGVDPHKFPGGDPVNEETARKFAALWGVEGAVPVASQPGLRTIEIMEAIHAERVSILYNIGGNLFETMPDPRFVAEALGRLELRVHQDIVLNSSMMLPGKEVLILPAKTRYEQEGGGTSTSTERRVRYSPPIEGPVVGESMAEWKILCEIGRRVRPSIAHAFSFSDGDAIRAEMSRVMPVYKEIGNLKHEGDAFQWGGSHLFDGGIFPKMPGSRARFSTPGIPNTEVPDGSLYVTTRRGAQFNSMHFGKKDLLTGGKRNDIFMNERDASKIRAKDGDLIKLTSDFGTMTGVCRHAPMMVRNAQVYWPEGNALIGWRHDAESGEPDYNVLVRYEKA